MAIESHINTRNIESTPWSISEQLDQVTLSRLANVSVDKQARATLQLIVQREAANEVRIVGNISAEVTMICQRCLQNCVCKINADLDEVFTEQSNLAGYHYKGDEDNNRQETEQGDYFDNEGRFSLLHYIEDEILLAVPTFPVHQDKQQCDADMLARLQEKATVKEKPENPFSVLKNLK